MIKVIEFYRKNVYGNEQEYIVPGQAKESASISLLTGKKTINKLIRGQLELLTDNQIQFKEVVQPTWLGLRGWGRHSL